MSNFKIVCGTIPQQEAIINLDKVKQIYLFEIKDKREVVVEDITNRNWKFETDLKDLSDVLCCVEFAFNGRIDFTQRTADFHNNSRSVEFEYAKQKGEALARGIRL